MSVSSVSKELDERAARAQIDSFLRLLAQNAPNWLSNLVQRQENAEQEFKARGYSAWPRMERHPLAAHLAAYDRWVHGPGEFNQLVAELADYAVAALAFECDWLGHEDWLVPRLRADEQCLATLFEMQVGLYMLGLGLRVQYVAPLGEAGPDLLLPWDRWSAAVDCTLLGADTGQRVPLLQAMFLLSDLMGWMEKANRNRIVQIWARGSYRGSDRNSLVQALSPHLTGTTGNRYHEVLQSRYRLRVQFGGTAQMPLSNADLQSHVREIESVPIRVGSMTVYQRAADPTLGQYGLRAASIASDQRDSVIERLVKNALDKAMQFSHDGPTIVVAGFARDLLAGQPGSVLVRRALDKETTQSLSRRQSLSAIMYLLTAGWHFDTDAQGRTGVIRPAAVHLHRNPSARIALPDDLWHALASGVEPKWAPTLGWDSPAATP